MESPTSVLQTCSESTVQYVYERQYTFKLYDISEHMFAHGAYQGMKKRKYPIVIIIVMDIELQRLDIAWAALSDLLLYSSACPLSAVGYYFALFFALHELSFTLSTTKAQEDWSTSIIGAKDKRKQNDTVENRMTIRKNNNRVPRVVQMQILFAPPCALFSFQASRQAYSIFRVNFSVDARSGLAREF